MTMAVGLIVDARQAEAVVVTGAADLVAIGREAQDDPNFAVHAFREPTAGYDVSSCRRGRGWPRASGCWDARPVDRPRPGAGGAARLSSALERCSSSWQGRTPAAGETLQERARSPIVGAWLTVGHWSRSRRAQLAAQVAGHVVALRRRRHLRRAVHDGEPRAPHPGLALVRHGLQRASLPARAPRLGRRPAPPRSDGARWVLRWLGTGLTAGYLSERLVRARSGWAADPVETPVVRGAVSRPPSWPSWPG